MKHSIIICTLFMFCLNTKLKAQTNFTKCQDIAISLLISSDYLKKVTKNREELIKKMAAVILASKHYPKILKK